MGPVERNECGDRVQSMCTVCIEAGHRTSAPALHQQVQRIAGKKRCDHRHTNIFFVEDCSL